MLRLLTDEQISPRVAVECIRHCPAMNIESLHRWLRGGFLHASDEDILAAAAQDGRTLVTYDLRTIAPLLRRFSEHGQVHAGVLFIDNRTIPSHQIGRLVRALVAQWEIAKGLAWKNRAEFLRDG